MEQKPKRAEARFSDSDLAAIRKRLQAGALEKDDLRKLEVIVKDLEAASRALRAAVIE